MLRNYFLVAIRNLRRQFLYSFINLAGLAVGLACSLVIFFYVHREWTHDHHFNNADRIYRIGVSFFNIGPFANGPERLTEVLPKSFEGIEAYTRFQANSNEVLRVDDREFKDVAYYVDSMFFRVFSYTFAEGGEHAAKMSRGSIVLTETMARKYFGDAPAIGKMIAVGKAKDLYVVTGIVEDDDQNSHLRASVWIALNPKDIPAPYWSSAAVHTYVLLRENVSEADLRQALDQVIAKEVYPLSRAAQSGTSLEAYTQDINSVKFYIHPLKDIYLKSKASLELSPGGNETNLYIFSIIAVFILVLASVNFINLSTARAMRRALEVGIRKALGTSRSTLILQFLCESVLLSLIAMVFALGIAEIFTFAFFWITGDQLSVPLWSSPGGMLGVLVFTLVTGVASGLYPAFYLTSFRPVKVLKGDLQPSRSQGFRNALVVFQFSISICLIICSIIILRQLNFIAGKDLGFDQNNVITIDNVQVLGNSALAYENELAQQPSVTGTSIHAGEPGSTAVLSYNTYKTARMPEDLTICTYIADESYLNVMGFHLIMGRNFNEALASDSNAIILNTAAVEALNLKDPIGAVLNDDLRVIGVVEDFHWESLRNAIAPVAIRLPESRPGPDQVPIAQLALKVQSAAIPALLKTAAARWKQLAPDETFDYHFLDENFAALLKKEEILGKAIAFFTVLAIIISSLGLFGLAAYTTEQRTKEIGIRKVLGASIPGIILMLNKQFARLVLTAILFAVPVSYYAAEQWLSGFAYRTDLSIWVFVVGGLSGLVLSVVTVAFHSVRASRTNPAETLKWE